MSNPHDVAVDQLRSFVKRIMRLDEERQSIMDDIKDVFQEAKSNGYDVSVLREVIRILKQDKAEREEREAVLETYLHALGVVPDFERTNTPGGVDPFS